MSGPTAALQASAVTRCSELTEPPSVTAEKRWSPWAACPDRASTSAPRQEGSHGSGIRVGCPQCPLFSPKVSRMAHKSFSGGWLYTFVCFQCVNVVVFPLKLVWNYYSCLFGERFCCIPHSTIAKTHQLIPTYTLNLHSAIYIYFYKHK